MSLEQLKNQLAVLEDDSENHWIIMQLLRRWNRENPDRPAHTKAEAMAL